VEGLKGRGAEEYMRGQLTTLEEMAQRLNTPTEAIAGKLDSLLAEVEAQRKRIERLERGLASAPGAAQLLEKASNVEGIRLLVSQVEAPSQEALRYLGDAVRKGLGSGAAVLGAAIDGRPYFLALVTPDLTSRLHAGRLLQAVAAITGGGGGGRPELAQGGGKDVAKLAEALEATPGILREMLETAD